MIFFFSFLSFPLPLTLWWNSDEDFPKLSLLLQEKMFIKIRLVSESRRGAETIQQIKDDPLDQAKAQAQNRCDNREKNQSIQALGRGCISLQNQLGDIFKQVSNDSQKEKKPCPFFSKGRSESLTME